MHTVDQLKQCKAFAQCTQQERERLAEYAEPFAVSAGEEIMTQGTPATFFDVVVAGSPGDEEE